MNMSKKGAIIKIGADVNEAKGELNKVTKQLNKLTKIAKTSSIAKFGAAFSGLSSAVKMGTDALKKLNSALNECNEAYKTQQKAEKALQVAAQNNPYLSASSVQRLKTFASELQAVSNIGDETAIQMMSQLAAMGRTESEITRIMGSAADYAAGANVSLETAIQTLNKAMNGNIGLLGKQIPELKKLTQEELEQGKAVDIIAQKYAGMAKGAIDSRTQAKNAIGDLKESIGSFGAPTFEAIDNMATKIASSFSNALAKFSDYLAITSSGAKELAEYSDHVNDAGESILKIYSDEQLQIALKHLEIQKNQNEETKQKIILLKEEISLRERQAKWEQREAEEQAKRDKEEEQRQKEKEKADKEYEKNKEKFLSEAKNLTRSELEALEEERNLIKSLYDGLNDEDKLKFSDDFIKKLEDVNNKITEVMNNVKEKQEEQTIQTVNDAFSCISQISSQIESSLSRIKDVMTANSEAEQEQLDEQLKTGLISQSQYEKEKVKLEQKAAMETYKINMAMWAAQLLQGAANIALGVTQALGSSPPPVNFIMAGVTAAAGAVEMGTLIASKPKRPSFETGGIVQGNSYSGDRVQANVNSGEMILNARQQAQLWKAATGNSAIGGMQVNIMNSAANIVSATPTLNGNTLDLRIDARVTSQASKGKYSQAFNQGETISTSGVTYPL